MKFYKPDGTSIDKVEFIEYYSDFYYYFVSYEYEKMILELLGKKEVLDSDDVKQIILWKTGAIEDAGVIKTRYPIKTLELNKIKMEKIDDNNEQARQFLKRISEIAGLGSTYMITLLFFASNGKFPIYDKFAHMALCAIKEGVIPHENIKTYKILPDKSGGYWNAYEEYRKLLKEVADGYEYKGFSDDNRKLDRALWVYGHMFKEKVIERRLKK